MTITIAHENSHIEPNTTTLMRQVVLSYYLLKFTPEHLKIFENNLHCNVSVVIESLKRSTQDENQALRTVTITRDPKRNHTAQFQTLIMMNN